MSKRSKTAYTGILSLTGLVVLGYFGHDYLSRTITPCETIFEQTSTQFDLSLTHLNVEGSIGLGRKQVQELTESAQVTALNLKTCCIVLNAGAVNPDQFLQCQDAGRRYKSKLDSVVEQVQSLQSAVRSGMTDVLESLRRDLTTTVIEATSIADELSRDLVQLSAAPAVPDPIADVPAESASLASKVDGAADAESLPSLPIQFDADSNEPLTVSSSPLTSVLVRPLTRFGRPEVEEILIVKAGTPLNSSFYPVQRSKEFGKPMLVDPGSYDVVLEFKGQSMLRLVQGLKLEDSEQATITPDALISFVVPSDLTLKGFPRLAEVFVMDAGAKLDSYFHKKQSFKDAGVPLVVPAGSYDVYVEPEGGRFIKLVGGVNVPQGRGVPVDANANAAALAYADPKLEGFELKRIYVVRANTELSRSYHPVQHATAYGEPMLVPAGADYDIVLEPVDGNPVRVHRNIAAEAGRLTQIPN